MQSKSPTADGQAKEMKKLKITRNWNLKKSTKEILIWTIQMITPRLP